MRHTRPHRVFLGKVRAMEAGKEAANARTFSAIFKNARTFWVISMWSRVSHFLYTISYLISHLEKLKGKQLERRRRRKEERKKKENQSRKSNRSKSAQKQPKMARFLTHSGATSNFWRF